MSLTLLFFHLQIWFFISIATFSTVSSSSTFTHWHIALCFFLLVSHCIHFICEGFHCLRVSSFLCCRRCHHCASSLFRCWCRCSSPPLSTSTAALHHRSWWSIPSSNLHYLWRNVGSINEGRWTRSSRRVLVSLEVHARCGEWVVRPSHLE